MLVDNRLPAETPIDKRIILATNAATTRDLRAYIDVFGMHVGAIGFTTSIEFIKQPQQRYRHVIPPLFLDAKVYQDEPFAMKQSMRFLLEHYMPRYITVPAAVSNVVLEAAAGEVQSFNDKHAGRNLEKKKLIMSLPFPNLSDEECIQRYGRNPLAVAEKMTFWALNSGLDGLVCGPRELPVVKETRERVGVPDFTIIAAGIRQARLIADEGSAIAHQKYQVCSAADALLAGADRILVGSAVTQAEDPCEAFYDIVTNAASV